MIEWYAIDTKKIRKQFIGNDKNHHVTVIGTILKQK